MNRSENFFLSGIDIIDSLNQELKNLDWNRSFPFAEVEEILNSFYNKKFLANWKLKDYHEEEFLLIANRSFEATTHYKWYLCNSEFFSIWIHEYKIRSSEMIDYVRTFHNHRYNFSSIILKGGFNQYFAKINYVNDNIKSFDLIADKKLKTGDIYSCDIHQIHSLNNIKQDTVSLVIKGQAIKNYSTSFNFEKMKTIKHYSFQSRYNEFLSMMNKNSS